MNGLEAERLSVALDGRPVLQDASFVAAPGVMTGLIGPNGAGKSTLLRALLRLVPLSAGLIRLDDEDISAWPTHRLEGRVGYLPQGQTIHWPLAVEALVALGRPVMARPLGRPSAEDREAVETALALTGLQDLRTRLVTSLSGGERARVLLARVLAGPGRIILADEPVASLDPYHQLAIMEVLSGAARAGRAVAVVLHDLSLAARFCDHLVLLDGGKVAADGPPAHVLTPERLAEVYHIDARLDGADLRLGGRLSV
ncbi:MAG: ABC transporter ATP-binding protein [Alphaproteobacteria bacterium]